MSLLPGAPPWCSQGRSNTPIARVGNRPRYPLKEKCTLRSLYTVILGVVLGYINGTFEEIAAAIEARDAPRAIKKVVTLSAIGLGVVGFLALILAVLYAGRKAILAVVAPIAMVAVLFKSYQLNHPSASTPTGPVQQPGTIELARARAERVYPPLTQTAFLLLSELCRYLPGLVKPFSLGAVVPPVHYDITASLLTIFHFLVAKGEDETVVATIQEILESLIGQHLQAQDLPMSIPAIYTSADGSTWPGLVVDGVYDIGQHYRVDLLICSEAAVARLKAREVSMLDGYATTGAIIQDGDFD